MEKILFNVEKAIGEANLSTELRMNPDWGADFKQIHSVRFPLGNEMAAHLFLHQHLFSDNAAQVLSIFKIDSPVAYILNCEGEEWTVKAELTSENKFGLIVYTAKGKPYLAGEGEVDSAGHWNAHFATIYPGIRNKKACRLQGGVRGGTGQPTEAQIGGTCTVHF